MKCESVKQNLWLIAADEAESALRAEIETHLGGCPGCLEEAARLRSTVSRLTETASLPAEYWEEYRRKVISRLPSRPTALRSVWRWAPTLAMALILVGGAAFYQVKEHRQQEEIVTNLELLENLDVLERDDFETAVQETEPVFGPQLEPVPEPAAPAQGGPS